MVELEWKGIKWKFIDRCFFFLLTCFSLVTFPKNLAQIFRSDRSTYVRNIFFHSFYTFEVLTHSVVEEKSLHKYLATLFEYKSWDLNIVAFFLCRALLTKNSRYQVSTFYIMNYGNPFTKKQFKKNASKQKGFILTETHWNSF